MKKILLVVLMVLVFTIPSMVSAAGSLVDVFVPESVNAMDMTKTELRTWSTPIWDWSADMIVGGGTLTAGVGTNMIGYKDMLFLRAEGVGNMEEGQSFITDGQVGPFIIGDIKKITEEFGVVSWIPKWIPHVGFGVVTQVNDHFGTAWKVRGFLKVIDTDTIFNGIERLFSSDK